MASKQQIKQRNHLELIEAGHEYLRQQAWEARYKKKHGYHAVSSPDVEVRKKGWAVVHRWQRALDLVGVANIVRAFEATKPVDKPAKGG